MRATKNICNLCGAKISTDEIVNNKQDKEIYGLYFTNGINAYNKYILKPLWDCNTHICEGCVNSIKTLFKDK